MKNADSHKKIIKMAQLAVLTALVVIIQVFFSSIKVAAVTLTFTLIPIVVAGIIIGPLGGLFIGFVSGVVTLIQVFVSADPFYVLLITANPIATAVICVLKNAAAGFISGVLFKAFIKIMRGKVYISSLIASIACPVVNTGIFCLGMLMFFGPALTGDPTFGSLISNGLVAFVFIGLAGVNFLVELALNIVICPVLCKALLASKLMK